jgi:hypothetical protein|tara:strand:+ start:441 stop:602 length:162 start_codon:yes stop_codon:yes gene_type:complete
MMGGLPPSRETERPDSQVTRLQGTEIVSSAQEQSYSKSLLTLFVSPIDDINSH